MRDAQRRHAFQGVRFGPGFHPGTKERLGGICGGSRDELVSRLTERTIGTESDRLEADAQVLVVDNFVGPAVLGGGVGVGAGSTYLTEIQPLEELELLVCL
mgnify:CR=1 FL=1